MGVEIRIYTLLWTSSQSVFESHYYYLKTWIFIYTLPFFQGKKKGFILHSFNFWIFIYNPFLRVFYATYLEAEKHIKKHIYSSFLLPTYCANIAAYVAIKLLKNEWLILVLLLELWRLIVLRILQCSKKWLIWILHNMYLICVTLAKTIRFILGHFSSYCAIHTQNIYVTQTQFLNRLLRFWSRKRLWN